MNVKEECGLFCFQTIRYRAVRIALACCVMFNATACDAESRSKASSAESAKAARAASKKARTVTKSPYGQKASDYVLSFAEEFDQGFNRKIWNDTIWYEESNPTINYAVEDGMLKIWPQRDAAGNFFNRTLDTDGKFDQTYGYFEVEAKLPIGRGTWPAFWLFNHIDERRPEIDIMEAYTGGIEPWGFLADDGQPHPQAYAPTVWLDEGIRAGTLQYDTRKDLSVGFHKYAVKWEPGKQTFYFDGKQTLTVYAPISDPLYIVLDLWFGSDSGTPDDSTPQGKANAFQVKYVRAWKFKKQSGSLPRR